ncbi:hypothetical protein [Streptomyces sp. NPDC047070]|uniref:hypothetical protein n=1 Tax=Streptomyces sp. NPDC047070 TaxID=3154923 RepID=UPI003455C130
MKHTLPVRRITRDELEDALLRDELRRRAEDGDLPALARLVHDWPEYLQNTVTRASTTQEPS